MNYELAKQLKDAGFPQEGDGGYALDNDCKDERDTCECMGYVPTLEELIGMCGDGSHGINRLYRIDDGQWAATGNDDFKDGVGTTPSEAVAWLWLALNKKETL